MSVPPLKRLATVQLSVPWTVVTLFGLAFVVLFAGIDRLLEWDEAVFFSQSGGYQSIDAPPVSLAASREGGPIGFIWAIRQFGLDLHSTRAVWAVTLLGGTGASFWLMGRTAGRTVGIVGFAVFVSMWISWVVSGFLHGPMVAGVAGVFALAAYAIGAESDGLRWNLVSGSVLGVALSLMLWFRPVESGAIIVAILAVSLLVDFRRFWMSRPVVWITTGVTTTALFLVPWILWSRALFGTLAARISRMRGQATADGWGLHWGVGDWVEMLSGKRRTTAAFSAPPSWVDVSMWFFFVLILVAVGFIVVLGLAKLKRGDRRGASIRLAAVVAFVVPTILYLFVRIETRERYAGLWWAYGSLVLALAMVDISSLYARRRKSSKERRVILGAAVVVLVLWLAGQTLIAIPIRNGLAGVEQVHASRAFFAREFVVSGDCFGATRFSAPVYQTITGCSVAALTSDAATVARAAERIELRGATGFIYWRGDRDLVELNENWFIPIGVDWGENRTMWIYQAIPDP